MGDFYKGRGGGGYRGGGGGYRGSRRGSDWRGSGGRGSFSSSRGDRGGSNRYFSSPQSSYESRSRSTYGNVPSDKFSRPRNDDYHGSSSSYSREVDYGRDDHRRQSPEPPRKRGRPDSSPPYMASRRSHERSYASGEYQGRSYVDKSGPGGGYLTEKGSYREVRESKPDYAFRKPAYSSRGVRGGFRGRPSARSWRGAPRGGRGFKSTMSYLARKRLETLGVRKRMTGRTDYIRRLPQFKSKRFARDGVKKSDDEEDDDDEEEEDDEEMGEEEEIEEVVEEGDEEEEEELEDEEIEEKEGDMDEGEGEDDKDDEKAAKKEEKESIDGEKKDDEVAGGDVKKEGDSSPKKKVIVKKKVIIKKVVKKAAAKEKVKTEDNKENAKDEDEEGEKGEGEEDDDKTRTNSRGQPFIRLKCPHCSYVCVTFNEYSRHLTTKKHVFAMRGLSTKLRSKLTSLRIGQRKKQRILDEEAKMNNLKLKTFFCQVCKLNYKTLKSDHFQSPEHKKIREFLAPYCKVCKISFKSPWAYENHISELLHIKRKAKSGEKFKKLEAEDIDLDPSSFMVLDAVGSGDEDEESDKSEAEEAKEGETAKEGDASSEKKKKKKEEIKLGAEHCKLVEVYFCELCKIYLPRSEDKEKGLTYHCRSRTHLERYVRHRGDMTLRRRAVKLHKELEKEKVKEMEKEKEKGTETQKKKAPKEEGEEKKEDDKSWSEVDKDLSDLLHDEEAAAENVQEATEDDHPDEDDDDSRQEGERYDRFKQSEKADKEGGKTPAAPNGSLSTDEIKKIDPVSKEEK